MTFGSKYYVCLLYTSIADTDKDFRKVKRMILKTFKYLMDGRDTVSYTHLDVYKRQVTIYLKHYILTKSIR